MYLLVVHCKRQTQTVKFCQFRSAIFLAAIAQQQKRSRCMLWISEMIPSPGKAARNSWILLLRQDTTRLWFSNTFHYLRFIHEVDFLSFIGLWRKCTATDRPINIVLMQELKVGLYLVEECRWHHGIFLRSSNEPILAGTLSLSAGVGDKRYQRRMPQQIYNNII